MSSEPAAWPITEPELLQRLRLDAEGFAAFMQETATSLGRRDYAPDLHDLACGYPWERPGASFVLRDDAVEPFDPALRRDRHALLAVGSNAAPWRLTGKLAHFEHPADRLVPVEAVVLHDFDVGAVPNPTTYASLPATLFVSPGARVRLHVLWVTTTQLTLLTWSELNYRFGRLTDVVLGSGEPTTLYVYISRFGTFAPDGEPVALAAIAAERRTAPAVTQRELLDRAAQIVLGADGATLVRRIYQDWGALMPTLAQRLRPLSVPFLAPNWMPLT